MCLKVYKGIYRGAYALVVSYLEATKEIIVADLREMVYTYLNDNGINVDFRQTQHQLVGIVIVRAGIETYRNRMTMDEALSYLSDKLEIIL